jgi:hypothetical protein
MVDTRWPAFISHRVRNVQKGCRPFGTLRAMCG